LDNIELPYHKNVQKPQNKLWGKLPSGIENQIIIR